jgi:hypothetical protein
MHPFFNFMVDRCRIDSLGLLSFNSFELNQMRRSEVIAAVSRFGDERTTLPWIEIQTRFFDPGEWGGSQGFAF